MDNNFDIKRGYNSIFIEKNGTTVSVSKGPDGDIWFNSLSGDISLPISFYSRDHKEWQSYVIFENLMKLIVGRYILSGDNKDEYSTLPEDFIDLENKTITWHSDSENNNKLQLKFGEKEIIVSITKDENAIKTTYDNAIKVRIRTSGSSYETYYKEFEKFFSELSIFCYQLEEMNNRDVPTSEIKYDKQRKLSIFNRFKK